MNSKVEIRVDRHVWSGEFEIYMATDGGKARAVNVTFKEVDEALKVPPVCSIGGREAQLLMDDLWRCGVRPTEGAGTAGAMEAVQAHLQDMRRLVFEREGR